MHTRVFKQNEVYRSFSGQPGKNGFLCTNNCKYKHIGKIIYVLQITLWFVHKAAEVGEEVGKARVENRDYIGFLLNEETGRGGDD